MREKNMDDRKGRVGKGKFDVEILELEIIWVNGTHATVNLARRIRGQRRQKRMAKLELRRRDEGSSGRCIKGCKGSRKNENASHVSFRIL